MSNYLIALKTFRKNDKISCFRTSFSGFRTSFSGLSYFVPEDLTGRDRMDCQILVSSHPVSRLGSWQDFPTHPGPWQDFELVPLNLWTMKALRSLCPEKLNCPVPLEMLVWNRPKIQFVQLDFQLNLSNIKYRWIGQEGFLWSMYIVKQDVLSKY